MGTPWRGAESAPATSAPKDLVIGALTATAPAWYETLGAPATSAAKDLVIGTPKTVVSTRWDSCGRCFPAPWWSRSLKCLGLSTGTADRERTLEDPWPLCAPDLPRISNSRDSTHYSKPEHPVPIDQFPPSFEMRGRS